MRTWCLLALCFAVPAWAHEDEEQDERSPDAGVVLVVPAAVEPQRQTTVRSARAVHSASEVTVGRDVIEAAPRAGATDLLRLVPGLVASQHSGEGKAQQLFLRGFDAVHGQDVELNVGGLPINEVSHLHALGYADLNWLIPQAVREVRVTEGSGRAAQGDFAVAGTVRYELGLEDPGLTVAAGYGSFNRRRLFFGLRPEASEQTFAAVEYVGGDGFGPARDFERLSAIGQGVVLVGPVKLRALLTTYGTTFSSPGVVRADAVTADDETFFRAYGAGQGGQSQRHQLLLSAEVAHETGRSTIEAYGALIDLTLRNNFTGFLADPRGDGLQQVQSTKLFGARALHTRHLHLLGQVFLLDLGVGVRHDDVSQTQRRYDEGTGVVRGASIGAATSFREAIDVRFGQTLASAWGEVAWAPGEWRFMLGGRIDVLQVDLTDALAFSGQGTRRQAFGPHVGLKVGVERGLGPNVRLFASYGDGFRTPQARQLSDGEQAPFVNVHGAEAGVKVETSVVSASLAGFGSYVANDFFFDHTVATTRFLGPTMRGGGQLNVTTRPLEGFLVSLNVTAAQARLTERDALLPYFAPLVGRLDSSYSRAFSVAGVSVKPVLGVGATLLGPRPLPDNEFSRAVFLLDARAGVRVGSIELTFDVQNALDSRWRDGEFVYASRWDASATASRLPARQFTAGSPRTLFFNLEVHL